MYRFSGCKNLTTAVIGDNVKEIDRNAFTNCSSLSSVTFGSNLQTIGQWAFSGCPLLKEVISKCSRPSHIDTQAFDEDTYREATLYIPEGTSVLYLVFNGWRNFLNIQEGEPNGILSVDADNALRVNGVRGGVMVNGAAASTPCQVYQLDGKLVCEQLLDGGSTMIPLPAGQVYVVRVGSKTIRVMVE
ncbi:MAG: leucine-rich repeat domain-containing protein [Prevotella sp.]|nr:leucine-rich repeat domain-containing protein [Prevotella sp.]